MGNGAICKDGASDRPSFFFGFKLKKSLRIVGFKRTKESQRERGAGKGAAHIVRTGAGESGPPDT